MSSISELLGLKDAPAASDLDDAAKQYLQVPFTFNSQGHFTYVVRVLCVLCCVLRLSDVVLCALCCAVLCAVLCFCSPWLRPAMQLRWAESTQRNATQPWLEESKHELQRATATLPGRPAQQEPLRHTAIKVADGTQPSR